ncbi:MAG: hypothetical protein WDZ96_02960 [Acidimicrobiia bacterium]
MKVGVLIGGGDHSVRAAHSLAADPLTDLVVVVGPAKSRSFRVVDDPSGLDVLVGSGPAAPEQARQFGLPLIWDGNDVAEGVRVSGASISGLAAAMAARERKVDVAAAAHPDYPPGTGDSVRFARPVGATQVDSVPLGPHTVLLGKSYTDYAACLVSTKKRELTIVDRAGFLSGIALAAGIAVFADSPRAVWDDSLSYLETATGMGLVMAEA